MTKLYALKGPGGKLYQDTLSRDEDCYQDSTDSLPHRLVEAYARAHGGFFYARDVIDWAVKRRGYTVVPVEVREVEE